MTALAARLDAALAAVHAGEAAPETLIAIYEEAAAQSNDPVQRGFFLTHAYVHALESGDARAEGLRATLKEMGRER